MDFAPSPRAADLAARVRAFVDTEIEPVEPGILRDVAARRARGEDAWPPPAVVERAAGQGPQPRACGTSSSRPGTVTRTPPASAPTAAPG